MTDAKPDALRVTYKVLLGALAVLTYAVLLAVGYQVARVEKKLDKLLEAQAVSETSVPSVAEPEEKHE